MGVGEAVEVGGYAIDDHHEDCAVLVEQVQSVVDRGSREGGYLWCKSRVDLVHSGVCAMFQKVVHHSHSLNGGADTELFEMFFGGLHCVIVLITLMITFLNSLQRYRLFNNLQTFLDFF